MITGQWFKAEYTPQDETSQVGGDPDYGAPMTGFLGELFEMGRSPALGEGAYYRYRKVFFQNQGNDISSGLAFFQSLQHIDQLKFAFEKASGDTATDSETMPAGYVEDDFTCPVGLGFATGFGTLTGLGALGMWVRQRVPEGLTSETGTLGVIRIAGVVAP